MSRPKQSDWVTLTLIGLLVLFAPVVLLVATLEALILFGGVELAELTLLELVELYLLDLAVLVLFAYAVYRVTLYAVRRQLPRTLDSLETDEPGSEADDVE